MNTYTLPPLLFVNVNTSPSSERTAPRSLVLAAFAAIYLIWGSTYLGIRFAVETMPPFLMGGARFLLAGGALYWFLRRKGAPQPNADQWRNAFVVGTLLLGVGNGGVNWAEQSVPSSVVALLIAITPLWFALLDWARPGGKRPTAQTALGLILGFAGMIILVGPEAGLGHVRLEPAGIGAVLVASIAWASGSLYSRYTPKPESPLLGGALQMMAGGIVLSFVGLLAGEADAFSVHRVSARSAWAFFYLVAVGSMVGFTAYAWLLKVSTPARVSTYAYVNPVIALFLGWALAGERLGARDFLAAAVILAGVIVITTAQPSAKN